jgi:hypothetical protein
MDTTRTLKRIAKLGLSIWIVLMSICMPAFAEEAVCEDPGPPKDQSIMLALLLDTSNSMDGLIEQAKSQLWKIVNELAAAKCGDGNRPTIKIALYEYGNDWLNGSEGYIRMVSPLTSDLDLLSEKLFSLRTNGGAEFCGHVIRTSLYQLAWSSSKADLKMIFIAGNEPFTQGNVPYRDACNLAKEKGVIVNTIYCGDFNEGLRTDWKNGSDITGGTYMSIEQNKRTVYISTPYDDRISSCNDRLNETYIYYGKRGAYKKGMQRTQDANAESYSKANKVERALSKSSHAYENSAWDLVDASKESDKVIEEADEKELPAAMRGLSVQQRKSYVKTKAEERRKIQLEMQELNKKRQEYINANMSKNDKDSMLDAAMIDAIKSRAKEKNIVWQ